MARRSYQQFCPLARSLDVVGERWTLLIARNLMREPQRYTDLRRGLPGMASNLLGDRLKQMRDADLIEQIETDGQDRWTLTDRGRELSDIAHAIGRFGLPYLDMPTDEQPLLDDQLPEALQILMLPEEMPTHSLTADFRLDEAHLVLTVDGAGQPGRRRSFIDRVHVDRPPDDTTVDDATVAVTGSLVTMLWVRRGDLSGPDAIDQELVHITGDERDVLAVRRVFGFER